MVAEASESMLESGREPLLERQKTTDGGFAGSSSFVELLDFT